MNFGIEHVFNNFKRISMSIEMCKEKQLTPSILILIFSSLDIAASLTITEERDVNRMDFIDWVDKYLLPELMAAANLDAISLYAARCAVLHSLSNVSSLSQKGKALKITYYWGKEAYNQFLGLQERVNDGKEIAIDIEDLINGYNAAINNFRLDASKDSSLNQNIAERGMNMFYGHEIK
jgi:hypothetical protein